LIRRKALGDCLVTLPAVRELIRKFPTAEIDLVIDRPFARLISLLVPEVNIISWSAKSEEVESGLSWYRKLWSSRYDLVIDWLGNPRTALWTAATGASLRVGYDLPRRRWAYNVAVPRNQHSSTNLRGFAGEAFLDPLRSLGLKPASWNPEYFNNEKPIIPEDELGSSYLQWRDQWQKKPHRPIALMMSATWPAKAWPVRHIADLIRGLLDKGESPLFVPGPGEEEMLAALRKDLPPSAFAPDTSLPELADLLSKCLAFVGTDCGGRHLATTLGLPTVTVFGPTDVEGWNPSSPSHVSITRDLNCLGCNFKICPIPGRPCLEDLKASEVMAGLDRVLSNTIGEKG